MHLVNFKPKTSPSILLLWEEEVSFEPALIGNFPSPSYYFNLTLEMPM